MITADFLIEWAIRSSVLIASGAVLLRLLRVKDPSTRLATWTAAVCGSLCMPLLTVAFPKLPVFVMQAPAASTLSATETARTFAGADRPLYQSQGIGSPQRVDWGSAVALVYVLGASVLLLRLGTGLLLAQRLSRQSHATELVATGVDVRESDRVTSPVTVGMARPVILLPTDWREWDRAKLDAVLAHERSHVGRKDPAIQFLSAAHRALLWYCPLSWILHRQIVRLAEEVSDDAAVAATGDRASYAEMLLEFMQRGAQANWHGVAMARYGSADARIDRILDGTNLSAGLTRRAAAAIFTLAVPLAYVTAAAIPVRAARSVVTTFVEAGPEAAAPTTVASQVVLAQGPTAPSTTRSSRSDEAVRRYIIVLDDTQSGSWGSGDSARPETLRSRFGNRFAWFRQGSTEHVITDEGVLREIERAMEPQKKVNAKQDQVNRLQSAVNDL